MHNIHFLSSCHGEIGNCNPLELYKIIKAINPDVIFEELDVSQYNNHYGKEGPFSTETKAISEYIQYRNIPHIPVDTYPIEKISRSDKKYMDDTFYHEDSEYRQLLEAQYKYMYLHGYKFLNSDEYMELFSKLQNIESGIRDKTHNHELKNIYDIWIETNNNREIEIIGNIYNYCKQNIFDVGLLIMGAEHKVSLKSKLKGYINNDTKINWCYWHDI